MLDYTEFSEFLNSVKKKSDIYSVVSRHTTLRQEGDLYVGRCPFHEDKGESLIVNRNEKIFYCFGCHAGGSVFKFIAMASNCNLIDAVKLQAKYIGIDSNTTKKNFDEEKFERRRQNLAEINEYARDFYHEILAESAAGESCRKYLESRGITKIAIEKFKLGFAPIGEKNLATFLDEYDFKSQLILESGLVTSEENNLVDKFQNCIVIPIEDGENVTSLVGRATDFEKKIFYESEENLSEYLYPEENVLFDKRNLIFGFNNAKNFIVDTQSVIIVKDWLTAILFASAGVGNVIATFDGNFTRENSEFLTPYAEQFIFCVKYGDEISIESDTLDDFHYNGKKVLIAALPENPEKFIRENSVENLTAQLQKTIPLQEYEYAKIIETIFRSNTELDTLNEEFGLNLKETPAEIQAKNLLIGLCWNEYSLTSTLKQLLSMKIFSESQLEIFKYLQICVEEDKPPDTSSAKDFLSPEANVELLKILHNEIKDADRDAFSDAVEFLNRQILKSKYIELSQTLTDSEDITIDDVKKLINMAN